MTFKASDAHYKQNRYYGRFAEISRTIIEELVEYLVLEGYLKIIGGERPVLALTRQGHAALEARTPIPLPLPAETPQTTPKDRSADETLRLALEGLSVAEIAAERGLAESTIYGHLEEQIGNGKLPLSAVVDDATAAQVRATIDNARTLAATPLKQRLPDTVSFGEIRCVVAAVRRERA